MQDTNIMEQVGSVGDERKYCLSSPSLDPYIYRTHVGNYTKDLSLVVLSAVRLVYFIYVLTKVYKSSSHFFGRPIFLNWLPIMIAVLSAITMCTGFYLLYYTVQGQGQVIC